jgi:hypothetical protein
MFIGIMKIHIWSYLYKNITHPEKTRQDTFESILEIIESVVSSPFVKTEAYLVEYVVLCLKRYVRLH